MSISDHSCLVLLIGTVGYEVGNRVGFMAEGFSTVKDAQTDQPSLITTITTEYNADNCPTLSGTNGFTGHIVLFRSNFETRFFGII